MNSELWPTDPLAAAALVALVVSSIQEADDVDRDALVSEFMHAAWPSGRAQRQ